jgi:hypothetical protein
MQVIGPSRQVADLTLEPLPSPRIATRQQVCNRLKRRVEDGGLSQPGVDRATEALELTHRARSQA